MNHWQLKRKINRNDPYWTTLDVFIRSVDFNTEESSSIVVFSTVILDFIGFDQFVWTISFVDFGNFLWSKNKEETIEPTSSTININIEETNSTQLSFVFKFSDEISANENASLYWSWTENLHCLIRFFFLKSFPFSFYSIRLLISFEHQITKYPKSKVSTFFFRNKKSKCKNRFHSQLFSTMHRFLLIFSTIFSLIEAKSNLPTGSFVFDFIVEWEEFLFSLSW